MSSSIPLHPAGLSPSVQAQTECREFLLRHLNRLCKNIGSRHCGSAGERAAADYIESVFRQYQLETRREYYPVRGWEFRSSELINITRGRAVPGFTACFYSHPIDRTGTLFRITRENIGELETLPVKDRLCFVEYWRPERENDPGYNQLAEKLDELGAAGAIFLSCSGIGLAPNTKIVRPPHLKSMAFAAVLPSGAFDLIHHVNDQYRLHIDAEPYDTESCNVIARIPGRTDHAAVIGAHYDTAPLIEGACDNGSGTVMVLELARMLRNRQFARTLELAAFSAEEYLDPKLPPGSYDYISRHKNQKMDWFLSLDDFGHLFGVPHFSIGFRDRLPAADFPFQPEDVTYFPSDDRSFHSAGIPSLWLGDHDPFSTIHSSEDSVDKIDFDRLTDGVFKMEYLIGQLADNGL